MNNEYFYELKQMSKPIIEFINRYYDKYTTIVIKEDSIKIVRDEIRIPIKID